MRLKSQQQSTNQRLRTHVAIPAILMVICLLTKAATGHAMTRATAAKQKTARQLQDKVSDDCDTVDGGAYHQPHFTQGRSVMVQLFEWKFEDVAEECRSFLGPKGYAGVQLSPVLEHTLIKTDAFNHPWWQRYETVSYRLASRSGDESDFWSMSRICNDHGVRIYVDVVLNDMAAPLHVLLNATSNKADFIVNTLLATDVNISNFVYPNVPYAAKDFHRPCAVGNTPNAHEMRNCQLNGHPDLDHTQSTVQQPIVGMLNKFIDMGVAGFRIDAAKHMWPIELKGIYGQLKDLSKEFNFETKARPFIYHDVFDMGLDSISKTEYSTYGVVSEYLYAAELSTILHGKAPLSSLINWGPAMGFVPHPDSLVFIDSHDTQRGLPRGLGNNRMVTYKLRQKYIMANALMLAYPYGRIKRIMSSYYFDESNVNQGPPSDESDEDVIRSPEFNDQQQCTVSSGWVCEHRWPPLVQLVAMANYFSVPGQEEESVIHFQTNGPNHIAFCRGHKAFVAMNNDPERDFVKEVFTCLEEGMYCDVISGGLKEGGKECHGRSLEVNAEGYARLNLPVADGDMPESEGINFVSIDDEAEEEERNVVESFGVLVVFAGSKVGLEGGVEELWLIKENESEIGEEVEENGTGPEEGTEDKSESESENPKDSTEDQPSDKAADVHGNGDADEEPETVVKQEPGDVEVEDEGGDEPAEENTPDETADHVEEIPEDDKGEDDEPDTENKEEIDEGANVSAEAITDEEAGDQAEDIEESEKEEDQEGSPGNVEEVEEPAEGNTEDGAEEPTDDVTGNEEEKDENVEDIEVPKEEEEPVEETPKNGEEEEHDQAEAKSEGNGENLEDTVEGGNDVSEGEGIPNEANVEAEEHDEEIAEEPTNDVTGNEEEKEEIEEDIEVLKEEKHVEETPANGEEEDHDQSQADNEGNGEDPGDAIEGENDVPEGERKPNEDSVEAAENPEETIPSDPGETTNEEGNDDENPDGESKDTDTDVSQTDLSEGVDNAEDSGVKTEGEEDNAGGSEKEDKEISKESEANAETEVNEEHITEEVPEQAEEAITESTENVENVADPEGQKPDDPKENGGEEPERAVEKIDKRETDEEQNENTEQQVEHPLTGENDKEFEFEHLNDLESNTQETSRNSTVEIINNITELQILANESRAAVKNEEVAAAGFFPPPQKRQGNGCQSMKQYSPLLWLIALNILVTDLELNKILFHLKLQLTPRAVLPKWP